MIKAEYIGGTFIIESGKIITKEPRLRKVYSLMNQIVYPWEGEPDHVLGKRLLKLLGEGKIIVKDFVDSIPDRIY